MPPKRKSACKSGGRAIARKRSIADAEIDSDSRENIYAETLVVPPSDPVLPDVQPTIFYQPDPAAIDAEIKTHLANYTREQCAIRGLGHAPVDRFRSNIESVAQGTVEAREMLKDALREKEDVDRAHYLIELADRERSTLY